MCGVAGIYSYNDLGQEVSHTELVRIRDYMVSRGPDDEGLWISPCSRVGLAHRRLAIIDPGPSGHQPMHRNGISITYNGEIYNFRKLKKGLEDAGYAFETGSDTEVILALYQEKGTAMLCELSGMFALAIWDQDRGKLILARDPYGIKPLYLADNGQCLRFASSTNALIAGGRVSSNIDPAAEIGFLMLGSVPEPMTIREEIKAMPPGCCICFDSRGRGEIECYRNISRQWQAGFQDYMAGDYDHSGIAGEIQDSVIRHLVSDVPVGVFLSAGVDSGAVAASPRNVAASRCIQRP